MDKIKAIEKMLLPDKELPKFKAGDNITVRYKIVEGSKERIQPFRGDVIQIRGSGLTTTFTVRKISNGVGVERIFPLYSPNIESIEVNKVGRVRRARIFYQRNLKGKKARIVEKKSFSTTEQDLTQQQSQAAANE
ncbi:MAG: 50S ribosomal protein L19 [Chitinophagales bacterium]|nr:MAG: 50S ribosomal protein L19 [Chitinophagales bacterium]